MHFYDIISGGVEASAWCCERVGAEEESQDMKLVAGACAHVFFPLLVMVASLVISGLFTCGIFVVFWCWFLRFWQMGRSFNVDHCCFAGNGCYGASDLVSGNDGTKCQVCCFSCLDFLLLIVPGLLWCFRLYEKWRQFLRSCLVWDFLSEFLVSLISEMKLVTAKQSECDTGIRYRVYL